MPLQVEAVFAIPILAIPIGGKSSTSTSTDPVAIPKIDINLKSIVALGGILILLFFVIPKLVHIYLPQKLMPEDQRSPGKMREILNTSDAI